MIEQFIISDLFVVESFVVLIILYHLSKVRPKNLIFFDHCKYLIL